MGEHLFVRSALSGSVERIPIWLMRQAGRYMKEYRAFRDKYSFLEMCKTPELACKVTMLPIDLLDVDAAILFADILIPLEALGMDVDFTDKGPSISNMIRNKGDIEGIEEYSPYDKLSFVMDSIALVQRELAARKPLIGFAGAPFTLMSYIIEGGSSPNLKRTKQWINEEPDLAHSLLRKITKSTTDYLNAQIKAGVDALQIFDTWAGLLSYDNFREFSFKYIKELLAGLDRRVPIIVFAKGLGLSYLDILELDLDVISVDWTISLSRLKAYIGDADIAIQGNLDPHLLYLSRDKIREHVSSLLSVMKSAGASKGYIFNLGHGVMPDIPFDNVRYLVDIVKELGIYGSGA